MNGIELVKQLSEIKDECERAVKALEQMQGKTHEGQVKIGSIQFMSAYTGGHTAYSHIDDGQLNTLLLDTALEYYKTALVNVTTKLQQANEAIEGVFTIGRQA